jgi:hypothetical protein
MPGPRRRGHETKRWEEYKHQVRTALGIIIGMDMITSSAPASKCRSTVAPCLCPQTMSGERTKLAS